MKMTWVYGKCTNCGRECVVRKISDREQLCEFCETPPWATKTNQPPEESSGGNTGASPR